jgi:hypothetical protein
MLIKKKSLVVAIISSFIISVVLILTLAGYLVYLELKDKELESTYQQLLQKVNAKLYSRHIEISGLTAAVENTGTLKGKPVVEGNLKNKGYREVADILMLVRFLDKDGAVLYEVVFHPQEPSLGASNMTQLALPYISSHPKTSIKQGDSFSFKKILANCPKEIASELKGRDHQGAWSGKLDAEIISVSF